jgi:hypothetical protein
MIRSVTTFDLQIVHGTFKGALEFTTLERVSLIRQKTTEVILEAVRKELTENLFTTNAEQMVNAINVAIFYHPGSLAHIDFIRLKVQQL